MKLYLRLLPLLCLLLPAHGTLGEEPPRSSQAIKTSFERMAADLHVPRPWKEGLPSPAQEQALAQLEQTAEGLMAQPDYAPVMLALFDEYRDQDGYPRQKLFAAISSSHRTQASDVPFYRDLFLAALQFKYDDYPVKTSLYWFTPGSIRTLLSQKILMASGRQVMPDKSDMALVDDNPRAWLAKYAP